MKKFFKISGIIVALILLLMIIVPYIFKDKIVAVVKNEINKNINANVDFNRVGLSLFRNFPDISVRFTELSVINNEPFEGDTLAYIPTLHATIDIMSVLRGDDIQIKKVNLNNSFINLLVKSDGRANWEIMKETDETDIEATPEEESSSLLIKLKKFTITNSKFVYDDKSLAFYLLLENVNHELSGDLTLDNTTLQTHTTAEKLTASYEGIRVLQEVDAELDSPLDIDFNKFLFTFNNSELRLNQFFLLFEGTFEMPDNGDYVMDFTYSSKRTDFKDFLSLIPVMYATDLKNISTAGNAIINGNLKGIYNDDSYPGFEFNALINNARFHYPDLPKSVDEININASIKYPGGIDFDKIEVDVPNLSLFLGGNKLSMELFVRNPVSDLALKGKIDGMINLSEIGDFYPLPNGENPQGKITANISLDGKMSTIEKRQYEAFNFDGSLLLDSFIMRSASIDKTIEIAKAQLSFSPRFVNLSHLDLKVDNNDLSANGKLENFIPYLLSDGVLKGNLQLNSNNFNITDLLPKTENSDLPDDTVAISPVKIPDNIEFSVQALFKKLIFDNIELTNTTGEMLIVDQELILKRLNMEVLGGTMFLNGKYDTRDSTQAKAELALNLNQIDIQKSYSTFGTINKFAPIAQKTDGKFNTSLNIKTLLDNQMMPVYSSMNGGGNLKTTNIVIENFSIANKIADLLKMPDLKRLLMGPVNLSFEFVNGKVHLKPFELSYQDINANTLGWISFDQTIDFEMAITIPRTKFGGAANSVLENLVNEANKLGTSFKLGEKVNITAKITGTTSDPVVKIMPGNGSGKSMLDDMKKRAQEELDKQKQKLEDEARKELEKRKAEAKAQSDKILADADKQAAQIINEAQKQADAINRAAQEAADKLKAETQKQSENMIADAKKKGPIAEAAAKKAAEQLKKETDKKAEKLIAEAKNNSDKLVSEAQRQSEKIRSDARNQVDKLMDIK